MIYRLLFIVILFTSCQQKEQFDDAWQLNWQKENGEIISVLSLPESIDKNQHFETKRGDIDFSVEVNNETDFNSIKAKAESSTAQKGFFLLQTKLPTDAIPYNFNGVVDSSEMYRQSPHDVNAWIVKTIPMQAVPMIGYRVDNQFNVAISNTPAFFENYTSQEFDLEEGILSLKGGDDGRSPGMQPDRSDVLDMDYNAEKTQIFTPGKVQSHYHEIGKNKPHDFEGFYFTCEATDRNDLRKSIIIRTGEFLSGKQTDFFGSLGLATAMMNLRANDSQKSDYWVIPAVEYANTQYGRDAFWIASMLPSKYAAECLKSELKEVNHFAEYPLFAIIWAYRSIQEGNKVALNQVQAYVDAIEERAKDSKYYSYYEGDGRLDFQYWGDVMAFEKDDIITYNQGLFALAITLAEELDLKITSNPAKATIHYQQLFDEDLGYFPLSEKKDVLGPDPLVPDLLSQIYHQKKLLKSDHVKKHYDRMVTYSKTNFGFKIVATPTGEYLPAEMYDIPGYISQVNRENMPDGRYFRGGSYFLYDNLFLMDAYLHGVEGAEDMLKWRIGLDFKIGSTTYECLNTKTGEPWKPNMGWNVAIYAFWRKLIDEGKADKSLLEYVDQIVVDKKTSENEKI
ncbi:hypothetical protein MY04_4677 [Flammeovirga sp. MY04]|uniref:hypothetical protein n=1 Tax=Flammeovirga sp. MY04 TaxID=1191459 RepID=UPI0008060BED|nr:hypothetical protein [Flammeovirga sp. MY04]ANQ52012.1 hypothetical protein MY04_4677 [Flammeovirga sp. MY04]